MTTFTSTHAAGAAAVLSRQFDCERYRALPTDQVTWTAQPRSPRVNCDECGAIQHETRGASGRPNPARHRRRIGGAGEYLVLCETHAQAWRDRDAYDTEPARYRRTVTAARTRR